MRYEKGTFITVPNKYALDGLDPAAQILFVWLCSYADDDGSCFPSITRLAENCGMSRDTVLRRLDVLCERGLLKKSPQFVDGQQTTNRYQIMLVEGSRERRGGSTQQPPQSHTATPRGSTQQHRTKSTLTKSNELNTNAAALGGNQWNELIDGFAPINPMYQDFYRITTERKALQELADRIGYDKLLATIRHLPQFVGQRYAPKITRPTELRRDLGKLIAFAKERRTSNAIVEI